MPFQMQSGEARYCLIASVLCIEYTLLYLCNFSRGYRFALLCFFPLLLSLHSETAVTVPTYTRELIPQVSK